MIMKKSILTVLFALICTMGFSQVSFNVKAGLNLSSYIGVRIQITPNLNPEHVSEWGWSISLMI